MSAAIALIVLSPLFGIVGIVLGNVGRGLVAKTAMIVSAVCLALGMVIGVIVLTSR